MTHLELLVRLLSTAPGLVIIEACGYTVQKGNDTLLVGASVVKRFTRHKDPCVSVRCQNRGICGVDLNKMHKCGCPPGTSGLLCEHGKQTTASMLDDDPRPHATGSYHFRTTNNATNASRQRHDTGLEYDWHRCRHHGRRVKQNEAPCTARVRRQLQRYVSLLFDDAGRTQHIAMP